MENKQFKLPTELPIVLPIKKIKDECKYIKTFFFDHNLDFRPGQFVMVWIPGLDEKPFTISYHDSKSFAISVQSKGKFTQRLFKMNVGDKLGFRGPYGNGFDIKKGKKACVVGGGCGIAPLAPLIEKLENPVVIIGAKSDDFLIFKERFSNAVFVTDDGSFGEKAFTTDALLKIIDKEKPEIVYTCGPEIMTKKIIDICNEKGIECYASMERYMKCGFGLCGQCVCDGKRVCVEGPVFDSKELAEMKDFGSFARLKTGKKVTLKEYYT